VRSLLPASNASFYETAHFLESRIPPPASRAPAPKRAILAAGMPPLLGNAFCVPPLAGATFDLASQAVAAFCACFSACLAALLAALLAAFRHSAPSQERQPYQP
jgi:hypothetical protein